MHLNTVLRAPRLLFSFRNWIWFIHVEDVWTVRLICKIYHVYFVFGPQLQFLPHIMANCETSLKIYFRFPTQAQGKEFHHSSSEGKALFFLSHLCTCNLCLQKLQLRLSENLDCLSPRDIIIIKKRRKTSKQVFFVSFIVSSMFDSEGGIISFTKFLSRSQLSTKFEFSSIYTTINASSGNSKGSMLPNTNFTRA